MNTARNNSTNRNRAKGRHWGRLTVAILLLGVVWMAASWFMGRRAVAGYCDWVKSGVPVEEARGRAQASGLRFGLLGVPDGQGTYSAIVTSSNVMGRYVCYVVHDGRAVVNATLRFND